MDGLMWFPVAFQPDFRGQFHLQGKEKLLQKDILCLRRDYLQQRLLPLITPSYM